jgi:transcriptional regulator with XRE-family HTH domain
MGETNMSLGLGKKIQEIRIKANDSQEALAAKLNISRQAISKWENNQSVPDASMVKRLSNLYNVNVSYFSDDDDDHQNQLYKSIRSLFLSDSRLNRFLFLLICSVSFLFFSIFSLFLTIPLFYINVKKNRILEAMIYLILITFGLHVY